MLASYDVIACLHLHLLPTQQVQLMLHLTSSILSKILNLVIVQCCKSERVAQPACKNGDSAAEVVGHPA